MDSLSIGITIAAGVFSGIGGILLQKYWSNKKPVISSTSVSFEGPLIQIPQNIYEQTKSSIFGETLEGFASFESLLKYEQKRGENKERVSQAKALAEQWIAKNQDALEKETLTKSELLTCPYFHTPVIGSFFHGHLRRRRQLAFPIRNLEKSDFRPVFEVESVNDKGITLHLGNKGVIFPISEEFGEEQVLANKTIAYSFLLGSAKNIRWMIEDFINEASKAIIQIETVRESIQGLLKQHAVLKFGVTITNTGSVPQLVKPYGAVAVKYGDSRKLFLVQHKIVKTKSKCSDLLLTLGKEDDSPINQATNVPYFLDQSDQSPHILVPGHKSLEVTFVSIEEEMPDTGGIIEFYQLGGVSTTVILETTNGKALVSPSTSFSKSLNNDRKEVLRVTANKALQRTSR